MSQYHYNPALNARDEVYDAAGTMKEHWRYLMESLEAMGPEAYQRRHEKALRILRDDGATYNIYTEQDSPVHTWKLDLIPSVIASDEWAAIEAGLQERAELFDLLLKDIYGPRDLIRTGVIPPEALFCHPGFLRPCQGISVPGNHQLILHSVDLMRDGSGDMCVLNDRTQAPSGAGYALENRTVMSRVLPSIFRDSHVHRLALYFQTLRATVANLCTTQDQPRVVILTPGTHNETYFEHAYLANYLGFHLVQSGDLVVRNGFVWMKALEGLSRVDVILRRVDDWFCDPVELRSDSQLGVPHLLDVARTGRVVIANPLGAGILESPIFLKYLPAISQALIGRPLRLKTVKTLWLGDGKDYQQVVSNLDQWVIKPISRSMGLTSQCGALLSNQEKSTLLEAIQAAPHKYVAQPMMSASNIPTFQDSEVVPRPGLLRSFAVASNTSYSVMPGGLTRVGVTENAFIISNQTGSQSKDTWVVASEPERIVTNLPGPDSALPMRDAELISLPSRVVENLFWMGRYAERTESVLRLMRTVFVMFSGEEVVSSDCRRILLNSVTELTATKPGFIDCDKEILYAPESELFRVVTDSQLAGSVRSNLNAMLYCADESKELLSSDTLRVINDIHDALSELDMGLTSAFGSAPEEALDPLVTALMALSGLAQESMLRGMGWRFMQMGRRLERAMQTTTLIRNILVKEVDVTDQNMLIQALLLTLENLISYRRRYRGRMGVQSSLDLVVLDTSNPRSLLYQLEQLSTHVKALPKASETRHELRLEERTALEAETLIRMMQLRTMCLREEGQRIHLDQTLAQLTDVLGSLSQYISDRYFAHKTPSQQLVTPTWGSQ